MMRVFMLGWEFPPYLSGGLGTACFGMTSALTRANTDVIFVLPRAKAGKDEASHVQLRSASGVEMDETAFHSFPGVERTSHSSRTEATQNPVDLVTHLWSEKLHLRFVDSPLRCYDTEELYRLRLKEGAEDHEGAGELDGASEAAVQQKERNVSKSRRQQVAQDRKVTLRLRGGYGPDLMSEVHRYSQAAGVLAQQEDFDVIHAHDWMTYLAGMVVKALTGKPLVVHSHALEFDRSGDNVNPQVSHIEWAGLQAADRVVAVSHYTKNRIVQRYGVSPDKIDVVYNAVNRHTMPAGWQTEKPVQGEKRVLFMGRITFQKGPEYFIEAARMVLNRLPDVRFIMAGSGDMMSRMVRRVARLRMGRRFHFTGFLTGEDVDRMYASSDLYVMPSVSEPFGIAPLEAMLYDVPVIISRQSGVAEVVHNALKVDFWDVKQLANMICAVLTYEPLMNEMVKNCREELKTIRWERAADRLNGIYSQLCEKR